MQYKTIFKMLGALLIIFSLSMLPPMIVALYYGDSSTYPYMISFLITISTGLLLAGLFNKASKNLKVRDGFLITVLIWTVLSCFGSLPLIIATVPDISFTDAIFETMSGLTTTGATILSGLDYMPHAIIYYRQQLQFLGGMGIVVLAVAILPMLGVGGMQLYRSEIPGPIKNNKLTPRITQTAQALWSIYLGLTIACVLCYWLAGMSLFNAIGESFATIATGGFTMHDTSFSYYHSTAIELVAIVFMFLGGANFTLHFIALKQKRLHAYWSDPEFRAYVYLILIIMSLCFSTLIYFHYYSTLTATIVDTLFDVVSLMTTTGFVTGYFASWPSFLPFLIMMVAMIGGCGGSTSGGVKVIRALIAVKQGAVEIKRLIHPRSIINLKLGASSLPLSLVQSIWGFIAMFLAVSIVCALLLLSQGNDITTVIGATVGSVANAGAAIGKVATNYKSLNHSSKWILILAMLAGRLEIFTLLVLISPSFWRK